MKIALFGGSFNPIHTDHLNIIKHAYEQLHYDQVWIIPTNLNPLKEDNMCDNKHRLKMIELATKDLDYTKIELFEINSNKKPNYTYDTVKYLKVTYPNYNFEFIVGSDNLDTLEQWDYFDELKKMIKFIVFSRGELSAKFKKIINRLDIELYHFNGIELSSTAIRRGDLLKFQLPIINNYINHHFLYVKNRMIAQGLDDKRINHSFNVANECEILAKRFKLDIYETKFAGLFHDITKFWTRKEHLAIMENFNSVFSSEPIPVLHSFSGALWLKNNLLIDNLNITNAIHKHTVGSKDMTGTDMAVFVADKISSERDYPKVDELRKLAKNNLEECFIACLKNQYYVAIEKYGQKNIGQELIKTYDFWVKGKK